MTKKRIFIILIVLIVLIIAAVAAVAVRNINEKPPVVVEQKVDTAPKAGDTPEVPVIVSSATFSGVDAVHWARGAVDVVAINDEAKLTFKDDFEVAQGPDLFVYLSPNEAGQELGEYASLGKLKSNKGTQEYTLPQNYKEYKTVVIWCRAFGVTFATADLQISQ